MKILLVVLVWCAVPASAFQSISFLRPSTYLRQSLDDERAAALSEYLAKAHEEKLRAVKEVETAKAAEIQALKNELEAIQNQSSSAMTSTATITSSDLESLSKEQLINKIYQYQTFMQDYIVKAQEQKYWAVKTAVEEVKKQLGALPAATTPPQVVRGNDQNTALYDARTAAVAAAAQAGKSRWGDKEVGKAGVNVGLSIAASTPVNGAVPAASAPPLPEAVQAADHGLRSSGAVGGPSLAERVTQGVNLGAAVVAAQQKAAPVASTVAVPSQAASSLYQRRNTKVVAAAAAGKSRWGAQEIERVQSLASLPSSPSIIVNGAVGELSTAPPEVLAADHGLRSQDGVGGLSLAERVALGAQASGGGVAVAAAAPAIDTKYQRRNVMVMAAAAAGKSRWGSKEIERVKSLGHALPSSPAPTTAGSSSPSIAERVNLGARLLGKA